MTLTERVAMVIAHEMYGEAATMAYDGAEKAWTENKRLAQSAIAIVLEEVVTVVFQQVPDSPRLVELVAAIRALGDSHD